MVFLSEADCCNNYSVHLFYLSTFQPPHLRVKKIFVGGLKPETTDQQIREYFGSKYAPVGFDNSKHFLWTLFIIAWIISTTDPAGADSLGGSRVLKKCWQLAV